MPCEYCLVVLCNNMRGVQSVRHSQREITQLVIKNVEEKSGREKDWKVEGAGGGRLRKYLVLWWMPGVLGKTVDKWGSPCCRSLGESLLQQYVLNNMHCHYVILPIYLLFNKLTKIK